MREGVRGVTLSGGHHADPGLHERDAASRPGILRIGLRQPAADRQAPLIIRERLVEATRGPLDARDVAQIDGDVELRSAVVGVRGEEGVVERPRTLVMGKGARVSPTHW